MLCFKPKSKTHALQDHTNMLKKYRNKIAASNQQQTPPVPRSSLIASNPPIQNKYEYIPRKYRSGCNRHKE